MSAAQGDRNTAPSGPGIWVWPVLIAANAICIGVFRHFVSLDGPLHVLHAVHAEARWVGEPVGTGDLHYDLSGVVLRATDVLLIPLMKVASPDMAHGALVMIILALLGWSCFALAHATTRKPGPMLVLMLPFTWGLPLVLGFYNFLLGVALCFLIIAWWEKRQVVHVRSLLLLYAAAILVTFVHRGAPILLLFMLTLTEAVKWRTDAPAWSERWSILRRSIWRVLLVLAFSTGAIVIIRIFPRRAVGEPVNIPEPWSDLISLRTLLYFDRDAERPLLLALSLILLLSLAAAAGARWHQRSRPYSGDGLLVAGSLLIVASFLLRWPAADLHYFSTRTQWVGLLLLSIWCGSVLPSSRWTIAAAVLVVVVHVVRLHYIERRMAQRLPEHQCLLEAAAHLSTGSVVVPVRCGSDWVMRHEAAWLAVVHDGLLIDRDSRLWISRDTPSGERLRKLMRDDKYRGGWLEQHLASGEGPMIDHVIALGPCDPVVDTVWKALSPGVRDHYTLMLKDEHVTVFGIK